MNTNTNSLENNTGCEHALQFSLIVTTIGIFHQLEHSTHSMELLAYFKKLNIKYP